MAHNSAQEVISMQVYHALEERIGRTLNDLTVWLSHNYDPEYWEPIFTEREKRLSEIRAWAKSLPHSPVRSEYLQWLFMD